MFTIYKRLPNTDWEMVAYRKNRDELEQIRIELEGQGYRILAVPCASFYTVKDLEPIEC